MQANWGNSEQFCRLFRAPFGMVPTKPSAALHNLTSLGNYGTVPNMQIIVHVRLPQGCWTGNIFSVHSKCFSTKPITRFCSENIPACILGYQSCVPEGAASAYHLRQLRFFYQPNADVLINSSLNVMQQLRSSIPDSPFNPITGLINLFRSDVGDTCKVERCTDRVLDCVLDCVLLGILNAILASNVITVVRLSDLSTTQTPAQYTPLA